MLNPLLHFRLAWEQLADVDTFGKQSQWRFDYILDPKTLLIADSLNE